jgi:hypothetical protein
MGIYNVLGFTHCKAQGNVITIAKTFEKIPHCDPTTHWFQVQTKIASNNPTTPLMQCSSLWPEPKIAIPHTHKQQGYSIFQQTTIHRVINLIVYT